MNQLPGIMLLETKNDERFASIQNSMNFFKKIHRDQLDIKASANGIGTDAEKSFGGCNSHGLVAVKRMFAKNSVSAGQDASDFNELDAVMESLSNILIAAVLSHAGGGETGEANSVDPKYWKEGFEALVSLFCHNYSDNLIKYNDEVEGMGIINSAMRICFNIDGSDPEGSLRNSIESYLTNQAELMKNFGYNSKIGNPYSLMGFENYTTTTGKRICAFSASFSNLTAEGSKFTRACREPKLHIKFDMKVETCKADFMLANWETSTDFKNKVREFIRDHKPTTPYFDNMNTSFVGLV